MLRSFKYQAVGPLATFINSTWHTLATAMSRPTRSDIRITAQHLHPIPYPHRASTTTTTTAISPTTTERNATFTTTTISH